MTTITGFTHVLQPSESVTQLTNSVLLLNCTTQLQSTSKLPGIESSILTLADPQGEGEGGGGVPMLISIFEDFLVI